MNIYECVCWGHEAPIAIVISKSENRAREILVCNSSTQDWENEEITLLLLGTTASNNKDERVVVVGC